MRTTLLVPVLFLAVFEMCAVAQDVAAPEQRATPPLYQVTIVSRTTTALNYGYLSAPTRIGFQGTPVAPSAKGKGTIEPKRGATVLGLQFENLPAPGTFGPQFLTYVVWAISPDGRAQNLGELILNASDEAKLSTSTPLQTFALIVTAEPYYSVPQPSGIVVLENVITRDTIGKVQQVNATYELLPRQPYTYDTAAQQAAPAGRLVSMQEYEATTALYQALNAIQIAQSQQADRYAPEQMSRARQLYDKARVFPIHLSKEIVSMAREATQIAEDSRAITVKRAAAEGTAEAGRAGQADQAQRHSRPQPESESTVQTTRNGSLVAQPERSRVQAAPALSAAGEAPEPITVDHSQFLRDDPKASQNRKRLLGALPRSFEVVDSSKGVTITIPTDSASSPLAQSYFSAVANAVKPYPGLRLVVEAHSGAPDSLNETGRDAVRVKEALVSAGISPDIIVTRGLGNAHPRGSNATANGRSRNRRIEIVIAGDAIGTLASWDRRYTLQSLRTSDSR